MPWNVRPMPIAARRCGAKMGDIPVAEHHLAVLRPVEAGKAIEQARLARPVRADNGVDLARSDSDRNFLERIDCTEAQAE